MLWLLVTTGAEEMVSMSEGVEGDFSKKDLIKTQL